MKLKKDKQIDYSSNAVFEGQDARIDPENMDKLWDLLQDPYKNPVGAVVREYVSNSFDSHAEAAFIKANSISDIRTEFPDYINYSDDEILDLQKHLQVFDDDAVLVTLGKDETGHYWATEDFGVGLSESRVLDVFCSYLKSTKENTNSAIGAFGIGSKSGLSYTDVIHIRTRYNGTERTYMLRKGEKSPRLDNLSVQQTTERNGTQIKIYIKTVKRYSWQGPVPETDKFIEECKKQLAYFDNVYFTGSYKSGLVNDYKIVEGKTWIKNTEVKPFNGTHLCLGKVAYPIDWDNLGIDRLESDVALKFEIGELDIIQTREDVKYTPRTKEAIINRIEEFKDEIESKWNEQYKKGIVNNFYDYLLYRKDYDVIEFNAGDSSNVINVHFNLQDIFSEEKYELDFAIVYEPFHKLNFNPIKVTDTAFFTDFSINSYVNESGLKHRSESVWNRLSDDKHPVYRIEGPHETKKSKYIVQSLEGETILFLRKNKPSLRNYVKYFSLSGYPKEEWRDIIKAIQKATKSLIFERTKSYQKVVIDKEWLKSTYKKRKSLDSSKFNLYRFNTRNSYDGGFESLKVRKNEVHKKFRSKPVIIGNKDQKHELKALGNLYHKILNIDYGYDLAKLFIGYVGERNFKYLKDLPNLITIENMVEHKLFVKYSTARFIKEKFHDSVLGLDDLSLLSGKIKNINSEISDKIKELFSFLNKYGYSPYNSETEIIDSFYERTVSEGILNEKWINLAEDIQKYFEGFGIFKYVNMRDIPEEELATIIYRFNKSLPISKHKKMNPHFYVNLNAKELEWLEGSSDEALYKKPRMLK